MLFNSYAFIFLFLPVALAGYFGLGRRSNLAPVIWLAAASLVFYSAGNWQFVALLLASIAFNYLIGYLLIAAKLAPATRPKGTAGIARGDEGAGRGLPRRALEYDPEKCEAAFRKDHAQTKT